MLQKDTTNMKDFVLHLMGTSSFRHQKSQNSHHKGFDSVLNWQDEPLRHIKSFLNTPTYTCVVAIFNERRIR